MRRKGLRLFAFIPIILYLQMAKSAAAEAADTEG